MTHAKSVVLTFTASGEGRKTILVFNGMQSITTSGEHLVWISLMSHIPHQAIIRCIENIMQGDSEFHRAQSSGEVATFLTNGVDQEITQFTSERFQVCQAEQSQVSRRLNGRSAAGNCGWKSLLTSLHGRVTLVENFSADAVPASRRVGAVLLQNLQST